ncbi:slowpoke-binding protein isoform X2 [Leptidea sinapis]|nr:slowpoke-binding protein isoform X2 [Leptidea sinapis]
MKANNEGKEGKEPETTGHDRYYQERPRSSYRKKKRKGACRRAQSAAELNPESIAAANKRNAFKIRSVSTDKEDSEDENSDRTPLVAQKIDYLAKLLFNKAFIGSGSEKNSPSDSSAKYSECSIESEVAMSICSEYLSKRKRYSLLLPLNSIGFRSNKHWFAIHDNSLKTKRLLTLMPLTSTCPIEPCERTQGLIIELLRALHHPYIYPVLDLEICNGHALAVVPFNSKGSLKDLLYKSTWSEEYLKKYNSVGSGLPASQVARFGRQILEGLLFLKDKGFPTFRHLHSGNVIIQNGVARICGLENTLIGAPPKFRYANSVPLEHVEALSLGYVMFEMCAATDTDISILPDFQANYPQVVEILEMIFGPRTPSLHELVMCELFRKIDLREMKGSCLPNFSQRLSHSCLSLLSEVSRQSTSRSDSTPRIKGDFVEPGKLNRDPKPTGISKSDSFTPGNKTNDFCQPRSFRGDVNPSREFDDSLLDDSNQFIKRSDVSTPKIVRSDAFEAPSTPTMRRRRYLHKQDSTDSW